MLRPLLTIELSCACLEADGAALLLPLLLVVVAAATGAAAVVVVTAVIVLGACGSLSVFALFAANACKRP
jgi:hypothetical protein